MDATKVLFVHNHYQQSGGEDTVFVAEASLLEGQGHRVTRYTVHNDAVRAMSPLQLALRTVWSAESYRTVRALIRAERPDLVHVHNTLPLLSPSIYYAARAEGRPVVQTLHNYRLLCPSAIFFRQGRACEDCLGRTPPWPSVRHACYRQSRAATATVTAMLTVHRFLGTWQRMVDVYIALTGFARQKFVQGGLPAEKIVVKPNFVYPDPGPAEGLGDYALFLGRLAPEKGITTLLRGWQQIGHHMPLWIVGDGPLASQVAATVQQVAGVKWLGPQPRDTALALLRRAALVVVPSEWYESFPMVIAEAFAAGRAVVASRLGAMAELIEHGRTGLLFRPGDSEDLAEKVAWAWAHPQALAKMGREARAEYEAKYTAERNYERLIEIYEAAVTRARARR